MIADAGTVPGGLVTFGESMGATSQSPRHGSAHQ
jgi:hypothetical protein